MLNLQHTVRQPGRESDGLDFGEFLAQLAVAGLVLAGKT